MRPVLAVTVLLAACLATTIATARPPGEQNLTFQQLNASGITGDIVLKEMPGGAETQFHAKISGLVPGTDYKLELFSSNATCGAGATSPIVEFIANKETEVVNVKVPSPITDFQSVGLRTPTALVGCAQ